MKSKFKTEIEKTKFKNEINFKRVNQKRILKMKRVFKNEINFKRVNQK